MLLLLEESKSSTSLVSSYKWPEKTSWICWRTTVTPEVSDVVLGLSLVLLRHIYSRNKHNTHTHV